MRFRTTFSGLTLWRGINSEGVAYVCTLGTAFANEDAGGLFPGSLGEADTRAFHQHRPSHGLVPSGRRLNIALVVILTSPKLTHTNGVTRIMTWVSLHGPSLAV